MRTIIRLGACAAAALMLAAGPAGACDATGDVQFQDDFTTLDPSWGNPSEYRRVENGNLIVTPKVDSYQIMQSQANVYDDADICVNFAAIKNPDPSNAYGGLLFWATDYDSYYIFNVASDGYYQVSRLVKGRWLTPVSWTQTSAVKQGLNTWNELRVETRGNQATLYINGEKIISFKGQPPKNGALIGLAALSPQNEQAEFRFADLVVKAPAETTSQ